MNYEKYYDFSIHNHIMKMLEGSVDHINERLIAKKKEIEAYKVALEEAKQEDSYYFKTLQSLEPLYDIIDETYNTIRGNGAKVVRTAAVALPALIVPYKKFYEVVEIKLSDSIESQIDNLINFISAVDSGENSKGWKIANRNTLALLLKNLSRSLEYLPKRLVNDRTEELMKEEV